MDLSGANAGDPPGKLDQDGARNDSHERAGEVATELVQVCVRRFGGVRGVPGCRFTGGLAGPCR